MTMESMVKTLESSGFKTTKRYDGSRSGYLFRISKDDFHAEKFFPYPADVSPGERDAKQRAFIDALIDLWHRHYIEFKRSNAGKFDYEFCRRMLNSTYGKFPNIPNLQLQLYAALMKGENNMAQAEKIYIQQDNNLAKLTAAMLDLNARINRSKLPGIKNVHFSGPCTVVIWEDKTKTIVRCKDGDEVDYEKGLAMAIAKKALGTNKSGSNYYDIFKKWLPKEEETQNNG